MEVHGVARTRRNQMAGRAVTLFTLEHANRALPLVRRIVADIVRCHKRLCILEERCQGPTPEGVDAAIDELRRRYGQELDQLATLTEELNAIGCTLKDPHRGIVDFYSAHRGRIIEFCWRIGEERILYWHEVDDGFHARRRINEELDAELAQPQASAR